MASPKITVGNAEIISLTDVEMQFPWATFFPNVPMHEMEKYRELYQESWGDIGFKTDAGCYAMRSEGKTILIDTGLGPGPHEFLRGATGNLIDDMKSKGVAPVDVDVVLHTHLHPDRPEWSPAFDLDGALASATRKKMMDGLVEEGHIAAFCHFPGEGFGRIVESNGKRVFQAL